MLLDHVVYGSLWFSFPHFRFLVGHLLAFLIVQMVVDVVSSCSFLSELSLLESPVSVDPMYRKHCVMYSSRLGS